MAKSKKPVIHQMTVAQFERAFPHEDACCAYLVRQRWPRAVACPRCGSIKAYPLKTMKWKWECPECREGGAYRFSHLVGTVFENTNKPLRDWFRVIHMMLTSKKGVSALQVKRVMGFGSYETAWYMCHRIRVALQDKDFLQLIGVVELDETFIGGKAENRHKDKRGGGKGGGGGIGSGKIPVVGALQRKGKIVARVIESIDAKTLLGFVREAVSRRVSLICTDQFKVYNALGIGYPKRGYPHRSVNHRHGEYVAGVVHTNTIEGFWSLLKRGVMGSYHKVSAKYLPLYVAEFSFRYNNRHNDDIFGAAIKGCRV
jgi:transposase-like protein